MFRFVHSADWQIGKPFGTIREPGTRGRLAAARFEAIDRLAAGARDHGAGHVVVAGDVFDAELPSDATLVRAAGHMGRAADIVWWLLPGNHDFDRPNGVWDRFVQKGVPPNVRLCRERAPMPMDAEERIWLLPAPYPARSNYEDLSAWMDAAETPEGAVRIGLAHGSIRGFGREDAVETNRIAPDRASQARLDWLALGDWHGALPVDLRTAYSGTPEPDDFPPGEGDLREGTALIVSIAAAGADPETETLRTGAFHWRRHRAHLASIDDVTRLEETVRGLAPDPSRLLLRLAVDGTLDLPARALFDDRIAGEAGLPAHLCDLRLDEAGLVAEPGEADLDAIDRPGGVVRAAANRLRRMADDPAEPDADTARRALMRLYAEHRRMEDA